MRLLYPSLFWGWALLALVPVLLYLFRPRPRTVRTSTLPFFKWLAREHQDSAWLRRLKHLLSLLLSLLVILGAAAALGRLVVAPAAGAVRTVVIVVDRSASMAASADGGPSRIEEAVELLKQRVAGLPAGTGVIVMAYDRRPEVLLARSLDQRQVQRTLASLRARPIEGEPAEALQLARRLAALETPASIWHATDALPGAEDSTRQAAGAGTTRVSDPGAEGASDPDDVSVEHLCVALQRPVNVGITAFRLRRLPLQQARFEAFVQVHCVGEGSVSANLDVELDGTLVAPRKLTIAPGGREKLLIPVEADPDAERILTLRLSAEGDVLDWDNVVHARIPRLRPVRVLWISESPDPFTELALSSLGVEGDLEVLQGPPSAWPPKDPVDVAIFDHWLPGDWPEDLPAIVIDPPGSAGPLRAVPIRTGGLPLDTVRDTGSDHPVLYGVATGRVALTQTAVVEAGGPLDALWVGPHGPVLAAGEVRAQRIVLMAFSPQQCERLPFMASYPLLLGNAIYWTAENRIESVQGMNLRTGELVELEAETLTWQSPGGDPDTESTVEVQGRCAELDRIGLWETDSGRRGSASLLSADETRIPGRQQDPAEARHVETTGSPFRGDLAPMLLWGVLAVLIMESWLFHRYFAY